MSKKVVNKKVSIKSNKLAASISSLAAPVPKPTLSGVWAETGAIIDPGLVKTELGWEVAEKPPAQFQNWWQNRADKYLQHNNQYGISQWDASTEYQIGSVVLASDIEHYQSITVNTGQDPISSPTDWEIAFSDNSGVVTSWDGLTTPVDVTAGANIDIAGGVISSTGADFLGKGVITGLTTFNAPVDLNNDITFMAGSSYSNIPGEIITLPSNLTKQSDAPWAIGDNLGGRFSGVPAINETLHVFVIKRISDGLVDGGFSTSPIAADIPAGWTVYNRIASLYRDASSNLVQYIQNPLYPNYFSLKDNRLVHEAAALDTAVLVNVGVPLGFTVSARLSVAGGNQLYSPGGEQLAILVTNPAQDDTPANRLSNWTTLLPGIGGAGINNPVIRSNVITDIITNTSGEVRVRSSFSTASDLSVWILLEGWTDLRGAI